MKGSSYDQLIQKLDQFIRKYYINELIKGILSSIAVLILCFLLFAIAEHFFYFSNVVRKVLFFSFIVLSLGTLFQWVALPVLHYFKLGKVISHEHAAKIIGAHFSEVKDKLLNILQLKETSSQSSLALASIEQKTKQLAPVPFQSAIDLRKNRKYIPFALPPVLVLSAILFAAPTVITNSAHRIIKNNQYFEREAPFQFILMNQELEVPQYEDYQLEVLIEGDYLPQHAFITVNGFQYRLQKNEPNKFAFTFQNVQDDVTFSLDAEGVSSQIYALDVIEKPNVMDMTAYVDYPAYTGRKDEVLKNTGDLIVNEGTKISWEIQTENTDHLIVQFAGQDPLEAVQSQENNYTFQNRVFGSQDYNLVFGNQRLPNSDSITYSIQSIDDQYPSISVQRFEDSLQSDLSYFIGETSDDYGLTRLSFNYQIVAENDDIKKDTFIELNFQPGSKAQFDYIINAADYDLEPGDQFMYYFEVFDNDAINGNKSSKTSIMTIAKPTIEQYEQWEEEDEEAIKEMLKKSLSESEELKKDFKDLKDKMLEEKELSWQSKNELEKLSQKQQEINKSIQDAQKTFQKTLENQNQFDQPSPDIQEKQDQLQKLFEELNDPETQELMQKIQELMEQLNKDDAIQMLEEMEYNEEQFMTELERLKELYEKLEFERDVMQQVDKLEQLAEEQLELSEETKPNQEGSEDQEDAEDADQEESSEDESDSNENEKDEQSDGQDSDQDNSAEENENEKNTDDSSNSDQENDQQDNKQENENSSSDGDNEKSQEELKEEQQGINDEFEDIEKQLEELQERNEQMQNPSGFENPEEMSQDIEQQLNQSMQNLQQQQNNKASQSQQKAGQQMQQMAQQLQQQMQQQQQQQMQEDMDAMRQLLENLIDLSFDQEDVIQRFSETNKNTPRFRDLVQEQYQIGDDFKLIEDSLQALSQRVFQIESFILDKVGEINKQMDRSVQLLEERKEVQAGNHQHRIMKNTNDLALMFSETMAQMQQQMAAMMAGSQMCNNPGNSNPSQGQGQMPMDKITQGQKQVNDQMKGLKDRLEQQMGKEGEGFSKEYAQIAAQQAALRRALEELQKEKMGQGKGSKELEKIIEEMNKIETDLVNKRLTTQMMRRQQQILTRLLEEEKAEREQEYENKRESKTAEDINRQLPDNLQEYLKKREAQIEPFKTISPSLRPYYKQLVDDYYKSLKVK